ncbi:D-tyrosyl-tRNA(Tyr) deacylase [Leptotrichia sp. oral taxon 218]|jgi:D-tyrosyl-tRNA(Tyr) deacylase|uniref:D-aminoacyl-tRNA deacylase n=1 Tax=Leptotrichia sp. oral taxon 218 TaxID=712361 RepID=UPI001B8B7A7C|nr:D-aminoacyl-tRNA deacylase [Leptotrichia sp. oral taxon 218]QUB95950.1 D-tyrosyl-tRNA(Tyr) deacylase [Leptotrichia sp. oral taxon 218]
MKIIIQRVNYAKMFVNDKFKEEIKEGVLAFIGVKTDDTKEDVEYCVEKLINLRIFNDESGKLNLSIKDLKKEVMAVSNFTIYGNTKKGRRPSFVDSAKAEKAKELYDLFLKKLREKSIKFGSGEFGEYMKIISESDGPVNLIIES